MFEFNALCGLDERRRRGKEEEWGRGGEESTDKAIIEGVEVSKSLAPLPHSPAGSLDSAIWGIILILGLVEVAPPRRFSCFDPWAEISTLKPHF